MRPNEHFYCECLKEPLAVLNLHTDKSYKAWNRLVLYHPCFHLPAGIWICFPWRNFRQFTHLLMRAKYSFLFSNLHTDRQQRALHSPEHLRETEREKVKKVPGREKEKNHPNNKLGKKKQLEWVKRSFPGTLLNGAFVALGCCGTEQRPQAVSCAAPHRSCFCGIISIAVHLTAAPKAGAVRNQTSHPLENSRASNFGFVANHK